MEQEIKAIIEKILNLLGVSYSDIEVSTDEKINSLRFVVFTTEPNILIGDKGKRLLAFNHIVKKIIEKKTEEKGLGRVDFMLDVNNFQQKRIEELRVKAHMLAERARFFKSSVEMEPMSSYERMIVHAEFTMTADINTESSGVGRERRVVLKYSEVSTEV